MSAEVSVPSVAPQHTVAATSSTQLSSIATAIEADLRALCTESRRSHPPIVDASERALAKLRTLSNPEVSPSSGVAKTPLQILQSQTVLRPFLLACASKLPKLTISALTSIQKLVSLTPLSAKFLASLMGTLRIQAENEDQTVQLKILQTLLITISPAAVECGELLQGSLLQALNICFRLFLQKKSSIIHHTAFAALRQLVTLLFDRVTWQSEKGLLWQQQKPQGAQAATVAADGSAVSDPANPNPHSSLLPSPLDQLSYEGQNAYLLFQDLCILCSAGSTATDPAAAPSGASGGSIAPSSGKPRWLTNLSAPIPSEVCIELMENILSSNHRLFQAQPLFFSYLIKSQVCALLIKLLRSHFEFGMVLRLIRTILVLIKYFHQQLRDEIEIFLSLFIRMMNFEFPLWHRVLVLEATLQMLHLNNDKFSYWLYANYDVAPSATAAATAAGTPANPNQTKIFTSLIHALSKLVVQTATNISEGMSPTASSVGGNLGVGSSGVSFNALITQSSTVPVLTVTTPSSPTASSASPSGVSSPMPFHFSLGKPDPLTLPTPVATLIWKLYSSKGNRGLDLLNLDQDSSSATSSANPAGGALSIHPSANLYEESYVITLGTECIVTIVNGFAALAKTNEKWGGGASGPSAAETAAAAPSTGNAAEGTYDAASLPLDPPVLRSLCTTGCMPTLAALSYLLNKTQEEAQIQHLLMSYQSFTNTCGVLELTKPRDMFLVNLCGFALPNNGLPRDDPPSELIKNLFGSGNLSNVLANQHSRNEFISNLSKILLSPKNIQSLKALFNISHCLSEYLGNSSWLTVLETFQTLDTMIQISTELSYRLSRDQNFSEMYQSLLPHQTEINIMAAALSRLFESTRYLDDAAVTHVLSALGTLSLSSLANAATSENGDRSSNLSHTLTPPTSASMNPTLPNNISSLNLPLNPPQTIRMFALMNLIATLEHNMFRITSARLWEIGIGHLTCVINHKDSQIRQYGVAALTKITILALSKPTTYQQQPSSANTNASQAQAQQLQANGGSSQAIRTSKSLAALSNLSPAEFHSAIQVSLLEPFSDLFRSKYEDTRENILLSVFQILQSAGQFLVKGGWKIVLGILQAVVSNVNQPAANAAAAAASDASSASASPEEPLSDGTSTSAKLAAAIPSSPSSSASFIHVGFNSVQLITNDYLESIPFSSLGALIHTITAYCAQTSDTNISFTSIGLLWRVSDYLLRKQNRANSLSNAVPARTNSPKPDPEIVTQPEAAGDDAFLTDELSDELMHVVFTSLVSLSVDVRTEVRNSAVKTLHNTLVAHSSRMAVETCLSNLGSIVLPLLTRLLTDASLETNSSNASSSSTELGKDKSGKSVMMLIHYSRDTASKQWDETRVYALQGTARVLKGFTENLLRVAIGSEPTWVEAFQQHWLQFLQLNLVALSNPSPEVTLSALNSVLDLVLLLFAGGSGSASSTASANAGLPTQPSALQPSSSATALPPSSYLTPQFISLLWTPILERFYVRGVLHAVVQHHHIEWCEERERLYEKEKKERKSNPSNFSTPLQPVSYISSPFKTSYGDLNSEEGWKNWLKTYTHLIANFHTLAVHARRIFELHSFNASRDDLIVILTLSNVLVGIHSLYNDRKLLSLLATRKLSAAASGTEVVVPDRKESPIQGAHLKLLETLTARTEPAAGATTPAAPLLLSDGLWTTMIAQLCSLLSLEHASADIGAIEARVQHALGGAIPTIGGGGAGGSETVSVPSFPSTSFAKRCLRVLDRCYSASPATVRARHFAQILSALQEAIRVSSTALQRNGMAEVAEEAVASFIHVLETGLQSMNEQMESLLTQQQADPQRLEKEKSDNAAVWATIVDIFSSFLSPPGGNPTSGEIDANPVYLPVNPSLNPAQQRLWENLQIALIGCLLRIVLPQIKHAQPSPTDIAKQVIRFFNISYRMQEGGAADQASNPPPPPAAAEDGSISIATVNNELLSHSCLMALFQLVKLGGSNADSAFSNHMLVSSLAAPLLLQRCERILTHYLYLERIHSPHQPIARCHREEVGFMLGELARLSIHPAVSQACFRNKKIPSLHQGQKGHLLALFPILCQCITMRESELRELLRDVFEQASIELGLAEPAAPSQ